MPQKSETGNATYISSLFEKCLESGFKLGNFMQAHPYIWPEFEKGPIIVISKLKFHWWQVNVILLLGRIAYVAGRFLQVCTTGASTTTTKIHVGFVFAFWLSSGALQLTHVFCQEELSQFTRQFLAYFKRFQALYGNGSKPPRIIKLYPFIMQQLLISWYINVSVLAVAGAVIPSSPEYLTSLAKEPDSLPFWIFCIAVGFDSYVLMVVLCGAVPIVFPLLGFHFVLKKCIPELSPEDAKYTNPYLRGPQVAIQELNSMNILTKLDNEVYKIFLPGIQLTIGTMLILCIYGCIRLSGMTVIVLGTVGINLSIVLILIFSTMASVHTQTGAVCRSLKLRTLRRLAMPNRISGLHGFVGRPLHRTQLTNLRAFGISIGSLFYIDKMQVVSMFEVILSYAITMLLMDPSA